MYLQLDDDIDSTSDEELPDYSPCELTACTVFDTSYHNTVVYKRNVAKHLLFSYCNIEVVSYLSLNEHVPLYVMTATASLSIQQKQCHTVTTTHAGSPHDADSICLVGLSLLCSKCYLLFFPEFPKKFSYYSFCYSCIQPIIP